MFDRRRLIESHEVALKPHVADYVAIGRCAKLDPNAAANVVGSLSGMGKAVPIIVDAEDVTKSAIDRDVYWNLPDRMRATCDADVTSIILEVWKSDLVGTYGSVGRYQVLLNAYVESCTLTIVERRLAKIIHTKVLKKYPPKIETVHYNERGDFIGGEGESLEAQLRGEVVRYIWRLGGLGWLSRLTRR